MDRLDEGEAGPSGRGGVMRSTQALREAIAEYDASATARGNAWAFVASNEDVLACIEADNDALDKVREAFWQLTSDRNSREHAYLADMTFMRKIAELDGLEEFKC
jgi:hypothetical protein